MLPGIEMMACGDLAVPQDVMAHVVNVESSSNPYAIGVVGGRLTRQPRSIGEAVATAKMLEEKGYNFSVGLAQVNRHNLKKQGLESYEAAFQQCRNLHAGARILAECHSRSGGDWGKSFSCYYSGNFVTGFRDGYVSRVFSSINADKAPSASNVVAIPVAVPAAPSKVPTRAEQAYFGRTTAAAPSRRVSTDQAKVGESSRRLDQGALIAAAPDAVANVSVATAQAGKFVTAPKDVKQEEMPARDPVVDAAFVF